MKNMKRALRRHHRARLLQREIRRFKDNMFEWDGGVWGEEYMMSNCRIGINTPQRCSCVCCGNPRRHFNELTMQERKANQIFKDR